MKNINLIIPVATGLSILACGPSKDNITPDHTPKPDPDPEVNAPKQKPNILIILMDDLGYSDVGCYGGEINTPNIDRLAAKGIRFRNFYNAARSAPTRASILQARMLEWIAVPFSRGSS